MNKKSIDIEIWDTEEMFIPYAQSGQVIYILSGLWEKYDPFDKKGSMQKWIHSKYESVTFLTKEEKIFLAKKPC